MRGFTNAIYISATNDKKHHTEPFGARLILSGFIWSVVGILLGAAGGAFHQVAIYEKTEYTVESVVMTTEDGKYYIKINTGDGESIRLRHIPNYSRGNNTITAIERYEK